MKAKGLDQLKALREQLLREHAEQEARAAENAEQAARDAAETCVFASAVGPVRTLRRNDRAQVARERPGPHPRQRELDERQAVREALSDEVDVESLLLTDDGLSFRRPGDRKSVV